MATTQTSLQFLGAAGTVTGSKYLLSIDGYNILIDCGLFQGEDEKQHNENALRSLPQNVDCVLLTHAHLDHTGFLPMLIKKGFTGKVYGTKPTLEITEIILNDSAKIAEEELKLSRKHHNKKHNKPLPDDEPWKYDRELVDATVKLFSPVDINEWISITDHIKVRFRYNGHIIGATFIEINIDGKTIVFSGDIGRQNDFLLFPPQQPEKADILIIESTYGDRNHPDDVEGQIENLLIEASKRNGTIIIPSFAVERMQMLMYVLWQMRTKDKIPNIPIYMDSPMGKNVLEIFHHNNTWHKLQPELCTQMCENIKLVRTVQETYELVDDKRPKIIIAGSGMVTGGRVLTYLQYYIQDPSTTILLAGFQAEGTNGRLLQEGVKELQIRDKLCAVNATVHSIEGLSGHAGQDELINWMNKLEKMPEKIFITHGETPSRMGLKDKIFEVYGTNSEIPQINECVELFNHAHIKVDEKMLTDH